MSEECKLEIVPNGDFKNIDISKMENGKSIVIKKLFADGLEKTASKGTRSWKFYIVKAEYLGEEVSFIMNERTHAEFKELGGIGDEIRLTFTKGIGEIKGKDGKVREFVKKNWAMELV